MAGLDQIQKIGHALAALGGQKLIALAIAGFTVFAIVGIGGYMLSKPQMEPLYTGLDGQDVTRMSVVLSEAGIPFTINTQGDAVLVPFANTGTARMILARQGLPRSAGSGYELFDNMGSLGLTSFMQEVTKVRALEGEIARTIQLMEGVRAARVHIVMPDEGSFRRESQKPSASVMLRTDQQQNYSAAAAIRQLVSAAVPGMTVNEVTVLDTDGTLLAADSGTNDPAPGRLAELEKKVNDEIRKNIRKTLLPVLGMENFQVSVATSLNTDRKQIKETIFDPDTRVERSVRKVKESGTSSNNSTTDETSVEQNIPQEAGTGGGAGDTSSNSKERNEQLTNYEISSKTVATTSDGYLIEKMSVAVVVDEIKLKESLGDKASAEDVNKRMAEIKTLVASAAGIWEKRGDQLTVQAMGFVRDGRNLEPVPDLGIMDQLLKQSGTMINALTLLAIAVMLIMFGLKPAARALLREPEQAQLTGNNTEAQSTVEGGAGNDADQVEGQTPNLIGDIASRMQHLPQKRLEQMIDLDEVRAANVLKQWVKQAEGLTA